MKMKVGREWVDMGPMAPYLPQRSLGGRALVDAAPIIPGGCPKTRGDGGQVLISVNGRYGMPKRKEVTP